ncbi:MATE family efflux transporter [Paenibacillus flagellatus]|uniref:Multidrug export protein MepA n=1 Tax=Paenibacillus flagellatus TaxID=2211139 RepID=A0A2V5JZT9_9BACL|nr:MATE family efflux transporter [Paenibacillus flagellatus]PYI51832.1 multidrug efflux MATE transporter FepA [Paenibacillus flagellatus]
MHTNNRGLASLETDSVGKVFVRYLIPSLVGMFMMSVNVVMDGIFVGRRLGEIALAGVNVAVPVFSIYIAVSLWVGIGGATIYSEHLGAGRHKEARSVFTHSLALIFGLTLLLAGLAFAFREKLAVFLGADAETMPYVMDYMTVLLAGGFAITVQNAFSVFVRNDGNPNLSMLSLLVTAVFNVVLNYWFLFVLDFGVSGSALALVIAATLGAGTLAAHFLRRDATLRFVKPRLSWTLMKRTFAIGFPSFLAEVGIAVFTAGYNMAMAHWVGTVGVSAFSVLNYVHSVMLMLFIGMGAAVQPPLGYYRGAGRTDRQRSLIRIAVATAFGTGLAVLLIGLAAADGIVSLFGMFAPEVRAMAVAGIRLFFIAYLVMGVNFVMMTYFQTTGHVKMAIWMTIAREMLLMAALLAVLPPVFGTTGIWLAIPISETIVLLTVFGYVRGRARSGQTSRSAA